MHVKAGCVCVGVGEGGSTGHTGLDLKPLFSVFYISQSAGREAAQLVLNARASSHFTERPIFDA